MQTAAERVREYAARLNIARVVQVDDYYAEEEPSVDDLLAGLEAALMAGDAVPSVGVLGGIDFSVMPDLWRDSVVRSWEDADAAGRAEVWAALGRPTSGVPADDARADRESARALRALFGENVDFLPLSLGEWRTRRDSLVAERDRTLFFFDRHFEREKQPRDTGIRVIEELAAQVPELMLGLLTHTATTDDPEQLWHELHTAGMAVPERLVVVAKQSLFDGDIEAFCRGLRQTAQARELATLRDACVSALVAAVQQAEQELRRQPVGDIDQAVIRSSINEGAAEVDTALRLFSTRVRIEARRALANDAAVWSAIERLRSEYNSKEQPRVKPLAWRLQRPELYESAEHLNGSLVAPDLGDVFEYVDASGAKRWFILAVQSCDLAVRTKTGRRKLDGADGVGGFGTLLEIVQQGPKAVVRRSDRPAADPKGNSKKGAASGPSNADVKRGASDGLRQGMAAAEQWWELPLFDPEKGLSAWVDLVTPHPVRLCLLDLCAVRQDGVALLHAQEEAVPTRLLPAWQLRFASLRKHWLSMWERLAAADDAARPLILEGYSALCLPTLGWPIVAAPDGRIGLPTLRRTFRVSQPRSGAMLSRMARYASRYAFEHEFQRVEDGIEED